VDGVDRIENEGILTLVVWQTKLNHRAECSFSGEEWKTLLTLARDSITVLRSQDGICLVAYIIK
jgi:hypothetical protein